MERKQYVARTGAYSENEIYVYLHPAADGRSYIKDLSNSADKSKNGKEIQAF